MKLLRSFKYAFMGIVNAVINERNFRIHIVAATFVAIFARLYGVTGNQAAILSMMVCLVMSAELLNTAVEEMVNIISPEKCRSAKIAKDSAAGAVLTFAIGATVVAVFIFSDFEKLRTAFSMLRLNMLWFVFYVCACFLFVFTLPPNLKKAEKAEKPYKADKD